MNNPIKVFGHKTPDTDTVISAIAYAWYLNEIKNTPATAYILGSLNKETEYVLKTFAIDTPEVLGKLTKEDKVVVVDTNNPDELPDDLKEAELIEIIDHHKLTGGITTATPLSITMRPMASTASLIYTIANPELNDMPVNIAGILLSGVLSDTLKFRSPTTTDEDIKIAKELAKIAKVDIDKHADAMFVAKSDISDLSASRILLMDSKIYEIKNNIKARLSVAETTNPESVFKIKEDIKKAMLEDLAKEKLDETLFYVIDILNQESTLIVATDSAKKLASEAYGVEFDDDTVKLPDMVSRKKQLLPPLMD